MELLVFVGLAWVFIAIANGNNTTEKPNNPVKKNTAAQKAKRARNLKSLGLEREHYWFESMKNGFKRKPWHLEFLVDLDKNKGDLQKQCNEGGELLEDVLDFVKSDPVLFKSVKVIVMKHSQRRYERYFGRLESKQNVKGLPTTTESFQGDEELRLIHDVLNASPILLETEEGYVNVNKPDLRKPQKGGGYYLESETEVQLHSANYAMRSVTFRVADTDKGGEFSEGQSVHDFYVADRIAFGTRGLLKIYVPEDVRLRGRETIMWEFVPGYI